MSEQYFLFDFLSFYLIRHMSQTDIIFIQRVVVVVVEWSRGAQGSGAGLVILKFGN